MAENKIRENTFKPKPVSEEKVNLIINDPDAPKKVEGPKKTIEKKSSEKKEKKVRKAKEPRTGKPDPRIRYGIGFLVLCLAFFLALSLISYFFSYFNGSYEETGTMLFNKAIQFDNITGKFGSFLAQVLIKESFGLGAFYFV